MLWLLLAFLCPHALVPNWRIHQARLGGPASVGFGGQQPHALLPQDVAPLLVQRRRILACVPEPLVPLRRHAHVTVVDGPWNLHDAAPPAGGRVGAAPRVAELPEGVAVQIQAWQAQPCTHDAFILAAEREMQSSGGRAVTESSTRTNEESPTPRQPERLPAAPCPLDHRDAPGRRHLQGARVTRWVSSRRAGEARLFIRRTHGEGGSSRRMSI